MDPNMQTSFDRKTKFCEQRPLKESIANNDHRRFIGVGLCTQCGDYMVRFENMNRCLSCQRSEPVKK